MNLLEIENLDLNTNTITAVFDGLFPEGFTVEAEFNFDQDQVNYRDDDVNEGDYFEPTNICFEEFKTFNSEEEEFTINNRELKKIKQLVEFKLIDLLTEELND